MLDRHQQARVDDERMLPRETRLAKRAHIPRKYWDLTGADYVLDDGNREMFERVRDWTLAFKLKDPPQRGILLAGPPGVGKTMLACIAAVNIADYGGMVRFLPLAEYVDTTIRQFKLEQFASDEAKQEWWETDFWLKDLVETAHLVVLDDVGKEHKTQSGYAEDVFDLFLRKRVALGRPVIMTTNVGVSQWGRVYSPAMQSFIYEAAEVVNATEATDKRRNR